MRTIFNLNCQKIKIPKSNVGQSPLRIYVATRVRRVGLIDYYKSNPYTNLTL